MQLGVASPGPVETGDWEPAGPYSGTLQTNRASPGWERPVEAGGKAVQRILRTSLQSTGTGVVK